MYNEHDCLTFLRVEMLLNFITSKKQLHQYLHMNVQERDCLTPLQVEMQLKLITS